SGVRAPLDEAEAANRLLADSGRLADELRRNWPALRDDLDRQSERRRPAAAAALEAARLAPIRTTASCLRDRLAVMKPGGDFDAARCSVQLAAPPPGNRQLSSWLPVGRESGSASRLFPQPVRDRSQLGRAARTRQLASLDTADGPQLKAIAAVNSTDQLLEPVWKAAEGLAVRVSSVHSDLAAGLVPDSGRTRSLEYVFLQVAPYWHLALVLMASLALTILVLGAAAYLLMAGSGLAFHAGLAAHAGRDAAVPGRRAVDTELCRFLNWRERASGLPALTQWPVLTLAAINRDRMRENGAPFQALLGDCRPRRAARPGGALNLPELVNGTKPTGPSAGCPRSVQLLNSRRDSLVGGLRLRPNLTELIRQAGAARTVDLSACAGSLTTSGSLTAAASADVIRGDPDGAGIAALHRISAAAVADLAEHQAWSRIVDQLDADLIRTLGRLSDQRAAVQQLSDARTRLIDLVGPDGRGGSRLADRLGVGRLFNPSSDALSEAIDAGAGANLTVGLSAGLVDAAAAALSGVADCRKISDALNGAVRAPCQSALRPFNGSGRAWASSWDYMAYQGFCPSDTGAS
uniref:Histidine kinase n=1 Tax=Macrostomum lignano TaxID=282301 RepID=A0A1I8FRF6_9PLAT